MTNRHHSFVRKFSTKAPGKNLKKSILCWFEMQYDFNLIFQNMQPVLVTREEKIARNQRNAGFCPWQTDFKLSSRDTVACVVKYFVRHKDQCTRMNDWSLFTTAQLLKMCDMLICKLSGLVRKCRQCVFDIIKQRLSNFPRKHRANKHVCILEDELVYRNGKKSWFKAPLVESDYVRACLHISLGASLENYNTLVL